LLIDPRILHLPHQHRHRLAVIRARRLQGGERDVVLLWLRGGPLRRVPAQPGLTCGLAAVRYRERFDAIVLQRQFLLGTVQPAHRSVHLTTAYRPTTLRSWIPSVSNRISASQGVSEFP
jgi:hypothetical protein